ncbi:putative porin [Paraburkholderia caledonica]|uniref:Porin n=1 Tax=Paraburkholderia caledonica TaxID=134536 RepID=A0AB73IMM3_9BURK|nr:putative porin [Paraburkholderia caledonica]
MNKSIGNLTVFAAVALSAMGMNVANAQSSVTIYGIVDDGFNWTSNSGGHKLYGMSSGVIQASRWDCVAKRTWAEVWLHCLSSRTVSI